MHLQSVLGGDRDRVGSVIRNVTQNYKVDSTQACTEHQPQWKKHIQKLTQHSMASVCRMLQRPNESLPWNPIQRRNHQPHDEDAPEVKLANFFRPP